MKKEYKKGDLTIVWESEKCIHSAICAKGLPEVFKPSERPWIQTDNSELDVIKKQIDQCPSGALSYYDNKSSDVKSENKPLCVQVIDNGPFLVNGDCTIVHKDGTEETRETRVALCRCGASSNKPFCDGTHKEIDFDK